MLSRVDFNTVFAVILALSVTPLFSWFVIKGLRRGTSGPDQLSITRANNPVLFWMFLSMYAAVAVLFIAFAVFSVAYERNQLTDVSVAAMLLATFCFAYEFLAIAGVVGYYTLKGFRTGRSVMFGQSYVYFSDRATEHVWFWFGLIFNVLFTAFLGIVGFGVAAIALWFAFGTPALW